MTLAACGSCVLAAILLLNLLVSQPASAALPPDFDDNQVASLGFITDFAFLPGGQLLISEKSGNIFLMEDPLSLGSNLTQVLDISGRICTNGERGINSMLIDPNFNSNRYVYVWYTWNWNNSCGTDSDDSPVNRLSRYSLTGDFKFDESTEIKLFQTDPVIKQYHNGGGVVWGNDDNIWLVTGDGGEREYNFYEAAGQKLDNLRAKLIRITPSGGIPADNPYQGPNSVRCSESGQTSEGKECQEIFALGLRNPWGLSIDPNDKSATRLMIIDVGGSKWEEVNLAGSDYPKRNYGFPVREGPCPLAETEECDNQDANFTGPYYFYIHLPNPDSTQKDMGACTAGDFIPAESGWPTEYDGQYFYADFVFNWIYILQDNEGSDCLSCNPPTSRFSGEEFIEVPRVTRIHFGPDVDGTKALYYATLGGNGMDGGLRKISYTGTANRGPEARISASPTYGAVPLTVTFDGSGGSDADGDALLFEWDFDGDGSVDSTSITTSFTFTTAGIYIVELTVNDQKGLNSSVTVRINAGNTPPQPVIASPAEGTTFSVGQVFTLVGSATDAEEGPLPDSSLEWLVDKHHAEHFHPYLQWTTGNSITIDAAPGPEDFIAATNSYLKVHLKAVDSTGLSTEVTRIIEPLKVNVEFDSDPSGLELILDGYKVTTPYTAVTWANHELKLEARNQGNNMFTNWSDGGGKSHFIKVGNKTTSYTALFRPLDLMPVFKSGSAPLTSEDPPSPIDGITGVFIQQLRNGKVVIINSERVIWESNPSSTLDDSYRTSLQSDGNFITRRSSDLQVVWKSQSEGGEIYESCGTAFVALEAGAQTLGIYCGNEDSITDILWVTETEPMELVTSTSPTTSPPTPGPTTSASDSAPTPGLSTSASDTAPSTSPPTPGTILVVSSVPTTALLPPTREPAVSSTSTTPTTRSPSESAAFSFKLFSFQPISIIVTAITLLAIWGAPF